ncbi:Ditrans,polycis-undecaprenyl-diphosphate synthase ((2E,6E)-farnesyl-diphosphate specific) [Paraliobacillus ryukyuensis]|uniref:Isoprenyl transferase n=1 Tax=Paraliobacillus ryukyuensis TaxID=200904 RepID=A0A366EEB8_9BACI|nr:isoprenyl transferase [Paraliobacillus ryukyuensis]RBP00754.1 undecaprenyl pyrophosphate synthetase [Paraliobacillus ryukyuensis]
MNTIPTHVAIIMDGNGRWGKLHGRSRSEGHYAGSQTMEELIDASAEIGVKILTLYAFSTENWKRPKEEVNYLMKLPIKFFKQKLPAFMKRNIKIVISGDIDNLPEETRKVVIKASKQTANNTGLIVNFALNYSSRSEIVHAMAHIIADVKEKKISIEQLDEQLFANYLYTKNLPDPDILIRTGGEKRISNFLMWQASTTELCFVDELFPDFTKELFFQTLERVTNGAKPSLV